MRTRSRRSASDYFAAALLEMSVMGIFIVIAQPQLRAAIIELVHPARAPLDSQTSLQHPDQMLRQLSATSSLGEQGLLGANALLSAQGSVNPASGASHLLAPRDNDSASRTALYSPLDHFESFAVSLPGNSMQAAQASSGQASTAQSRRLSRYAPSDTPTQLTSGDWNIAAAAQSPRPITGWTPSRPADADYRDTYPPPFGTQSQWK